MLRAVFDQMFAALGPQFWWPAETPFEVIVGAVLTQNTNWQNVERAIEQLRQANSLSIAAILNAEEELLQQWIRPSGYFRLKAKRLRSVVRFIHDRYDGSLEKMFREDTETLRKQLLSVYGVGPETADSILLYAGHQAKFVIDTYTARIWKRHGWIDPAADYHQMQHFFETRLPPDAKLFNEFHALIVMVGKDFCKPTPRCDGCPLQNMLPPDGPLHWPETKR